VLLVYGTGSLIDALRTGRRVHGADLFWLTVGGLAMALTAPLLSRESWWVVGVYLPLGVLWTVPLCPVWKRSARSLTFCAPRDLLVKPYLLSTLFTFACVGLPSVQRSAPAVLPLGEAAWLSGPTYTVLVVTFILTAASAHALTMDAASLHDARPGQRPRGIALLGAARLRLMWAKALATQLLLAVLLALGSDNRLVGAGAAVGAVYTLFAMRAVFATPNRWLRSLACGFQGISLGLGMLMAWLVASLL
jgi:hypothetical protein